MSESKLTDQEVLDLIVNDKDKFDSLVYRINRLNIDLELQKQRQQGITEDIKVCAEDLGMSPSLFKSLLKDVGSDDLDKVIKFRTAIVDVLTEISNKG